MNHNKNKYTNREVVLLVIIGILVLGIWILYEHHQEEQRRWYAELHECEWSVQYDGVHMVDACR